MIRSLWTAASGMQAQQVNIDVIANNLANVNTAGFKKSRADFQDLMYQTVKLTGAPSTQSTQNPTGIQVGLGVKPASVSKIFTAGTISQTGNDLDIAIEGDGFFQITLPDGTTAYTRAGTFKRDSTGKVVTPEGNPISPEVVIPASASKVNIGNDGTVSVLQPGQSAPAQIGSITLAAFSNPAGLYAMGKNLFLETAASGAPVSGTAGQSGLGTMSQGYLEMSNVNIMEEMVSMITGQRAYEINSKAVQASDEMLKEAANLKR